MDWSQKKPVLHRPKAVRNVAIIDTKCISHFFFFFFTGDSNIWAIKMISILTNDVPHCYNEEQLDKEKYLFVFTEKSGI